MHNFGRQILISDLKCQYYLFNISYLQGFQYFVREGKQGAGRESHRSFDIMSMIDLLQKEQMIGAIAGDMVGSPYEVHPITHKSFDIVVSAFTDDTVLTVAVKLGSKVVVRSLILTYHFHSQRFVKLKDLPSLSSLASVGVCKRSGGPKTETIFKDEAVFESEKKSHLMFKF